MIEITRTSPFNTVQDLGRPGFRHIGVTASGAMDPFALKLGNALLGNDGGSAAIEVQTFPFQLRFSASTAFVITGVDCEATLDGQTVLPWCAATADAGQVLDIAHPRHGARAYVCLAGGVDVAAVMGSCSTSLRGGFGGNGGRFLAVGDRLALGLANRAGDIPPCGLAMVEPAVMLADVFPVAPDGALLVRAIPAGEHGLFGADAERFWKQTWKLSPQSDRTGYRLSGEPIRPVTPVEMRSHGIVPGVVQVPPAGQPIIQMADANTAGGYPKIAGVIEPDLWRLGQARIGSTLRFVQSSHAEAVAIEKAMNGFVEDVRRTSGMVKRALMALA